MSDRSVSIKVAVPASALGGGNNLDDKATRQSLASTAEGHLREAVESAARNAGGGVSVRDFATRYTRKGNVKATFTVTGVPGHYSDSEVENRVIAALNPLSQRAGASDLSVSVADVNA